MYLDPTLPGCTVFDVHDDILVYNMYSIIVHFVYIFHESEVLLIQGALMFGLSTGCYFCI